ncbi:MAG: RluA family pseudouridine synthase [Actinomycetota bacterium]|nr:RluA family pseudouridine synthase [Actinomycetota bacterium]
MTSASGEDFTIPPSLEGERADRIVALLTDVSRKRARAACEQGDVVLEGSVVKPADRLVAGAVLSITTHREEHAMVPDPSIEFGVAYEDATVIVVDKPAGLVVHPGAGRQEGTLAHGLLAAYPELRELDEDHRWGIVHRIDRDTSGLLLVARTAAGHCTLQDALRRREVSREYLSLVAGGFGNAIGTIDAPIGRDPARPTQMRVIETGRPSRTHYRRLASWDGAEVTLLAVHLESGRTHQIRVHCRAIGHPVVGDPVYGPGRPVGGDPGRTWLHAERLSFDHPETGERLTIESDLPADLRESLALLGSPDRGSIASLPTPDDATTVD